MCRQQQDARQRAESAVYIRAPQDPQYRDDLYLTAKSHPYRAHHHQQQQEQQLPHTATAKYKAYPRGAQPGGGGGHVNIYSRKMESRPLPSLPNIPAAAELSKSDDDPSMCIAEIHRTNSQASSQAHYQAPLYTGAGGASTMVAGAGRPRTASARSQSSTDGDPQYFVLDPDELSLEDVEACNRHAARTANAHSSVDTDAAEPGTSGGGGKSPEEENEENQDKETHLNNSCHEIPLRPSRETPQSSRTEINNTGNTSWP